MKFYRCTNCEQVHVSVIDSDKTLVCCDMPTIELHGNDNKEELIGHRINVRTVGRFLTVSLIEDHPVVDVHHIEFICLETNEGFHYKTLQQNGKLKAEFVLSKNEELLHIYLYCNVHALFRFNPKGDVLQ